jgi:hypothetical protein
MIIRQLAYQHVEVMLGARLDRMIEQDGLDELLGRLLAKISGVAGSSPAPA